jgi:hypothetical protein
MMFGWQVRPMPDKSIFHRIVTKEDHYTQLLCNTLQREPSLLGELLVLVDARLRDRIETGDIRPQVRLNECGQADLLIQSDNPPKLRMLFEVKTAPHRPLEETQKLNGNRPGYKDWLEKKRAENYDAWLVYLVPGNWEYRQENEEAIKEYQASSGQRAMSVCQIYWHNVLELLQKNDSRAEGHFVKEFWHLLMERLGPINFSSKEIERMFTPDFPMKTLIKVNAVLEGLRTRAAKREVKPVSDSNEFGFYLSDGEREMFVGLSQEFWDAGHHYPISFGVSDKDARVKDAFSRAFEREYRQKPISVATMEWTMGGVPQKDFNRFETANAIDEIWGKLAPIWESVKEAQ